MTPLTYLSADKLALLVRYFSIFHPAHVHADLWHNDEQEPDLGPNSIYVGEPMAVDVHGNSTYPSKCMSTLSDFMFSPVILLFYCLPLSELSTSSFTIFAVPEIDLKKFIS